MKVIPIALDTHYASGAHRLARLWKATRTDGRIFGFTSHDADITYAGLVYRNTSAFDPSAVETTADLAVDNLEVVGMLDDDGITEADIEAGLWDGHVVEVFDIDWSNPAGGVEIVRTGEVGNLQLRRGQYVAEMRGLMQALQQNIGRVIAPNCDADLGDDRCKVALGGSPGLRQSGVVAAASARNGFSASGLVGADGYFDGGEVAFTSGDDNGLRMEVKTHTGADLVLQLQLPYLPAPGDTFTIIPGCNKTKAHCSGKFSNLVNFRGFDFVPGQDQALVIGGQ